MQRNLDNLIYDAKHSEGTFALTDAQKADILSIPAGIVRPDEVVQSNREQRAQALQAQQQLAAMSQGATMAKDLSQANLEGENALSSLINSTK